MAFKTGTPFNDDIFGTEFFDQLEGLGGNDRLYGLAGNDILKGGDGDDLLDGGSGNDQLEGGPGSDTYEIDSFLDNPVELAGEGIFDRINTSLAAYALPQHFEVLFYSGSADFWGVGNDQMNVIAGGAGDDILDGGAEADSLLGGDGNDIFIFDDAGDVASELAGFGIDQIQTDLLSLTLPENVEILAYFGTGDFEGTGNDDDNYLQGDEGDDRLTALAGNDLLDGLTGADTMIGGEGDDKYRVDSFLDVVTELDGEGVDEVSTAIGDKTNAGIYVLPSFVEYFVGTSSAAQGAWLNAQNNVALMGPGNDLVVLHDGGIDYVDGGAGNDFFYWGSSFATPDSASDDRAVGGAGNDTVGLLGNYNLVLTPTCLVGIERLAMYSAGNAPGVTPNSYAITTVDANVAAGASLVVIALSLRGVETLTFNGAAESDGRFNVRGGRGGDTITTGAGSDQINGFLGADQLRGGGGNDYFEYYDALHSTAAAMDSILDFTAGDRINLFVMDADGNAANGNSAFAFIGANAFTNVAGQLRAYQSAGGGWFVEGDVNGDGNADLVISVTVTDLHALTAADFLL